MTIGGYPNGMKSTRFAFHFRKGTRRFTISEGQAQELISKIGLIEVRSVLLVNASSFRTKNYISSELDRLKGLAQEKQLELEDINYEIFNLNKSLLNA